MSEKTKVFGGALDPGTTDGARLANAVQDVAEALNGIRAAQAAGAQALVRIAQVMERQDAMAQPEEAS